MHNLLNFKFTTYYWENGTNSRFIRPNLPINYFSPKFSKKSTPPQLTFHQLVEGLKSKKRKRIYEHSPQIDGPNM